ncbi:MAG: hypothetical protein CL489_08805 [Acidobacteria bacterium]|nr:hypothetical protein [Acidobacteriota bacterium]|tara:strand:- start:5284 stop:5490 length:207 start_codon:yes stop_codon:yes gene_type:complete
MTGHIVYTDDIVRITWNGSSTFNIYRLSYDGAYWINIDVFTVYFDDSDKLEKAKNIAKNHMKEIYEGY